MSTMSTTTVIPTIHCGDDLPHRAHDVRNTGDQYACPGTMSFEEEVEAQTAMRFVAVGGELADEFPILRSLRGLANDYEQQHYSSVMAWERLYVLRESRLIECVVRFLPGSMSWDNDYQSTTHRVVLAADETVEIGRFTTSIDGRA